MSYIPNDDNIYATGSTISAKVRPDVPLTIMGYYHRIYYCAVQSEPKGKQFAYFERELVPPVA